MQRTIEAGLAARLRQLARVRPARIRLGYTGLLVFSQLQIVGVVAGLYGPVGGKEILLALFYAVVGVCCVNELLEKAPPASASLKAASKE